MNIAQLPVVKILIFFFLFFGLRIALPLVLPAIKGWIGERIVRWKISLAGFEALHDFVLPTSTGKLTQIDHLVKTPGGLVCIETKNYSGTIYASSRRKQWTRKPGRQRFFNPLFQNYGHISAIRQYTGDIPVSGYVVFAGSAKFATEIPRNVGYLRNVPERLEKASEPLVDPKVLETAWKKLSEVALTDRLSRRKHLAQVKAR